MSWLGGYKPSTSKISEAELKEARDKKLAEDRLFRAQQREKRYKQTPNGIGGEGGIHVDVGRVLLSAYSTSRRVGGEGDREVEELVSYSFQIPKLL